MSKGSAAPFPFPKTAMLGRMRVILRMPEKEEKTLEGPRKVREVLEALGINPEGVIVARGEELLTLDDRVADEDTIEVISAVSGGRT